MSARTLVDREVEVSSEGARTSIRQKSRCYQTDSDTFSILLSASAELIDERVSPPTSAAPIAFDNIVAASQSHGIPTFVLEYLRRYNLVVEQDTIARLKQAAILERIRAMFAQRELASISKLGRSHGISFVPFKGAALLKSLYPNRIRDMSDIDVLVRASDAGRALSVLYEIGYRPNRNLNLEQARHFLVHAGAVELIHPEKYLPLDLHTRIVEVEFGFNHLPDFIFEKGEVPDDVHFFFLLAHGSKHLWRRLIWLVDMALLSKRLKRGSDVSPERAREVGLLREFQAWQTLHAALFDKRASRKSSFYCSVVGRPGRESVIVSLIENQWSQAARLHFALRATLVHVMFIESFAELLRYVTAKLFLPRADDFDRSVGYSTGFFMSRFWRPIRLLRRLIGTAATSALLCFHRRAGAA